MLPSFRFHHIGIATRSINATAAYYTQAGYAKTDNTIDPRQNVEICFLEKDGMPLVELLAPVDDQSPVNRTLASVGVAPYHCCYAVDNIDDAARELRQMRFALVARPTEAVALGGRRVCFLYNKDVGLVELLEDKGSK